jgi:DUF1680 family protein
VLGEPKYLAAIRNAWDMLETTQQFASGGWGPKEAFVPPHEGKLGESLTTSRDHFETPCGCYAHTKLARYLLRFTGESRYGDGLERIIYNALLASKDPGGDGEYFYYSDYQALARRGYYKRKWPCCSGTLIQAVADYVLDIYFHRGTSLYVNLYTPSQVIWNVNGVPVTVSQKTQYPDDGEIEFLIRIPLPVEFSVNLRIPGWLESNADIAVNGKQVGVRADRNSFAEIKRRWQDKDTIRLRLPLEFRVAPVDDKHPERVAMMRGPQMMVAVNPPEGLHETALTLPGKPQAIAHRASAFSLRDRSGAVELVPFHAVRDETYTTYLLKA